MSKERAESSVYWYSMIYQAYGISLSPNRPVRLKWGRRESKRGVDGQTRVESVVYEVEEVSRSHSKAKVRWQGST